MKAIHTTLYSLSFWLKLLPPLFDDEILAGMETGRASFRSRIQMLDVTFFKKNIILRQSLLKFAGIRCVKILHYIKGIKGLSEKRLRKTENKHDHNHRMVCH